MSGEAVGLILLPLALAGMPMVVGGLAVAGVTAAAIGASRAASRRNREQQIRRAIISGGANSTYTSYYNNNNNANTNVHTNVHTNNYNSANSSTNINTSILEGHIGNFRAEINQSMNNQAQRNMQASQQMMHELEMQRNNLQNVAQQNDIQAFQAYSDQLKQSRTQTMQNIYQVQNEVNTEYQKKIAESMASVTENINRQYSAYLGELQQLQNDMAAKEKKAQEIAQIYIDEAKTLLKSLVDDFEGQKFSSRQIVILNEQLNQAISLYNSGRYESAIASSKDVAVNTLEEIYEADAKKQEWENYYSLALVLSEEVKSFVEAQGTITEEVKAYAEKATGKQLEGDIVGISVSDYTEKNSKGQTRYDYILHKVTELYNALRADNAGQLTTDQLKECVNFLNNDLYPSAVQCISRGVINMNNAFSRQNMSEEIIDFFEEHNFTFSGYAYENDCHDKALHIGLENEETGEELIVTLAPEVLESGDIQTKVDLKQIKGDEANEERKAYYRECIESVVKGNNPYAQVDIKCKAETKNRLSADTETKKKLKSD